MLRTHLAFYRELVGRFLPVHCVSSLEYARFSDMRGKTRARASSSPSCSYHGDAGVVAGRRGFQVAHEAGAQVREEWNPERERRPGKGKPLYGPATADRQRTTHARERPCVPSSATPGSVGVLLLFRTLREGKSSFVQTDAQTVTCNRSYLPRYLVAGLLNHTRSSSHNREKQEEEVGRTSSLTLEGFCEGI